MRHLMTAIYKRCLGIRVTTARQHVEDLRKMVNDLCNARDALDAEIAAAVNRLVDARLRLDQLQTTPQPIPDRRQA